MRYLLYGFLLLVFSLSSMAAPPINYYNPADYFEFTVPILPAFGEIIDLSEPLEAPAGKDGFVTIKDGHFYSGEKQLRFLGANIAFAGAFPLKGEAKLVARKLAKYGINLVRLHSLDATDGRPSLISTKDGTSQKLNPEYLDRLDRLIYELKEKGIYVNINLHINRYFQTGDEVVQADLLTNFSKGANLFDRRMIELQKEYAKAFLTHVNPYTGNAYTDEPSVAAVEFTNENSFFYSFYSGRIDSLPPYYLNQLSELFTAYLQKKYATTDALQSAWHSKSRSLVGLKENESLETLITIPLQKENRPRQVWKDYMAFLQQIEQAFFCEMYDFLKNELGVKAPLTGTMAFGLGGLASQKELDFIDIHAYMNHPYYTEGDWQGQWFIENRPLVNQLKGQPLEWAAVHRLEGKPFVMSEFNTPYPNWYEADSLPLFATFARRQDWDGLYIFDFNASGNYMPEKVTTFFDIDGHPVKMAELIMAHNLFVRGDLEVAPNEIKAKVPLKEAVDTMVDYSWNNTHLALRRLGLKDFPDFDQGFSLEFAAESSSETVEKKEESVSPLKVIENKKSRPYVTLDTPRTKYAVGFSASNKIELSDLFFTPLNTNSLYSAVLFTSLDKEPNPISKSNQILIIAAGRTENNFTIWNKDYTNATFGMEPVKTEGIPVEVVLNHEAEKIYVYALDYSSCLQNSLKVQKGPEGFSFRLDPEYKTIWYLVSTEDLE